MSTWNDAIDEINDLDVQAELEKTTPAEESDKDQTSGESDEKAEDTTPEKEEGEQKPDESDEAAVEDKDTDSADEKDTDATDEKDSKDEKSDEQTFEIDGETYTLDQLREFRDNGMTKQGYTQQRQKEKAEMDAKREAYEAKEKLAEDISEDPGLREFLKAHPEGLKYLMSDPESTRTLLGDTKKVEAFWKDYEVLLENPEIAERLAKAESQPEAADELEVERQVETMEKVVAGLGYAVDQVGKEHYPDVDPEEVKAYLVELSGLPDKEELTLAEQQEAVSRLWQLFYVQGEEGQLEIRPQLIVSHYERLNAKAAVDAPDKDAAKEHNRQVDEKLEEDSKPPKTPEGKTPLTEAEMAEMPSDFRAALEDILE